MLRPVETGPDPMTPLLLVGHGTRDAVGVAAFRAFVERVQRRDGMPAVAGGFIELSTPPLADAVRELVSAGNRHLAGVPVVLVAAGHAKGDIPAALARERLRHPGLRIGYGRPLGPHPTILRLLIERLDAVLPPAERDGAAVLLVGRGSTDPDANAEVHRAARLLWELTGAANVDARLPGAGVAMVEPAFVSLAEPGVVAGLERCRRLGARRVVVLPFFLFPGVLPDRVAEQARGYASEHPDLDVRVADVVGDCDGLADVIVERYLETVAGDVHANCDACLYRVALPQFEHRQGAPQRPHDHPHDHGHVHAH
jgi:sirohydrochlorin cobaltochelatase